MLLTFVGLSLCVSFSSSADLEPIKCDTLNITPCECASAMSQIRCEGPQVTDTFMNTFIARLNSLTVAKDRVHLLMIKNTAITVLSSELFTKIEFDRIIIEDNANLTKILINTTEVKSTNLKDLTIQNNQNLNGQSLFKLAQKLKPASIIDFDGNKIDIINSDSFDGSFIKVENIFLSGNPITEIKAQAFKNLENIIQIELNKNTHLKTINENWLTFENIASKHLTIFLNDNNLKEANILSLYQKINKNITLDIHLENNLIDTLDEISIKKSLAERNVVLHLYGNILKCDAKACWLKDLKKEDPLLKKLTGIGCNNTITGKFVTINAIDRKTMNCNA